MVTTDLTSFLGFNLGLYLFTVPHCVITLNTEINTTDIDSVLNVIWYKYSGSDTIQLTSNDISATSYAKNGKYFVSQFNIFTIEDYPLHTGQYQCVAWIRQEMYRNMSTKAVASLKSKHTSFLSFFMLY